MLIETEAIGESGLNVELGSIQATEVPVAQYLRAVGNNLPIYGQTGVAPLLFLSAASLGLLLRELALPPGAVHSLQETEALAPVPIGEEYLVTASLERPRQRAGLKFLTATCNLRASGGQPVMTSKTTVMLAEAASATQERDGGRISPGATGETPASELPVVCGTITREQLIEYSVASGDDNPLHLDDEFAGKTQFGGIIAHGMLTLAYVDQMMAAALGGAWLETGSLRVRFKGAAYLNDRIESWGAAAKSGKFAIGVRNSLSGQELISGTAGLKTT